jgi:hypothetical protein
MLDVHDDVDVVEQRPSPLAPAFPPRRLVPRDPHLLLDLVDDRIDLSLVGRGGDDETVGDDQLPGNIDHDDVGRQLLGRCLRGDRGHADRLLGRTHRLRSSCAIELAS